jgi:hypothetical protein
VIGGYELGGDYEWASYSAYFGHATRVLYQQVEAQTAPVIKPTPTPTPTKPTSTPTKLTASPTASPTSTAPSSVPSVTSSPTPTL